MFWSLITTPVVLVVLDLVVLLGRHSDWADAVLPALTALSFAQSAIYAPRARRAVRRAREG
jgi:hypothetical protein